MKRNRAAAFFLAVAVITAGIDTTAVNVNAAETTGAEENSSLYTAESVQSSASTAESPAASIGDPNVNSSETNAATESSVQDTNVEGPDIEDSDMDADQGNDIPAQTGAETTDTAGPGTETDPTGDASDYNTTEPDDLSTQSITEIPDNSDTADTEENFSEDAPDISLSSDDGVSVTFPAGTFSSDTISLRTSTVTDESLLEKADAAIAKELNHSQVHRILAYDLIFYDGDQELEPEKEVKVSLPLENSVSGRSYYIVHLSDGGDEIVPAALSEDGTTAEFTLSTFSPVVLYDDAIVIDSWSFSGDEAALLKGNELTLTTEMSGTDISSQSGSAKGLRRNARLMTAAASADDIFSFDYIVSKLPKTITTEIDGRQTELQLTWSKDKTDYKQNSDGTWPQSGTYTFTATLDSKYETTNPIIVTVKLSDNGTTINRPGLTVSAAWGDNKEELTDEGLELTVDRETTFNLPISAGWPEGSTDKEIDLTYAYGLSFGYIWDQSGSSCCYNTLSKTAHWYQQLEDMETPVENHTTVIFQNRKAFNGTLKLKFKDSTDALDIVDPNTGNTLWATTYGGYITDLGLNSIGSSDSPALTVTLSYTLNGQKYSIEKKINTVTFTSQTDHLLNHVSIDDRVASYNEKRESQVIVSNPVTAEARWSADVLDANGSRIGIQTEGFMDDMYLCFELPKNVYLADNSVYQKFVQYYDADKVSLPDGTTYSRTSTENKIMILKTGKMAGSSTLAVSGDIGSLYLKWKFEDATDGALYKVAMVRTGMLYHNTENHWLKGDNQVSLSFRMIPDEEEVFINAPYGSSTKQLQGTNGGDWIWTYGEGAAGIGKEQEYILGGINLGNRKTKASVPKTITIDYDADNDHYYGVSQQNFNYNNKDYTNLYNLKVTLINPTTGEVQTPEISKELEQKIFQKNCVCRKDFSDSPDWYLKEVKYSIQSIPARTKEDDVGRSMPFYGYVLRLPEKSVNLSDVRATVEDAAVDYNGDAVTPSHGSITGISQVKLYNGIISNVPYVYAGTAAMTIGSRDNTVSGWIRQYGYNYMGYATYIDALYFISPYGDELQDFRLSSTRNKVARTLDVPADMINELDRSTLNLPDGYDKAKVYKIDLTQLTSEEDKQYFRLVGSKHVTTAESKTDPYGTGGDISFSYVTNIVYSDRSGAVGKDFGGLVYIQPHYPDNGQMPNFALYSDSMRDDTLNLTGNTSNRVTSGYSWQINGTDSLTVATSGKMTTEDSSAYRTWDSKDQTSYIGSNNDINFRITIANTTTQSIRGISLYMPVPKKQDGAGWNGTANSDADFIQNDNYVTGEQGVFGFNMDLRGGGTADTSGYQFEYAIADNPSVKSEDWKNYKWYTADEITMMGAWAEVNFIHIANDTPIEPTQQSHIDFVFNAPNDVAKPGCGYTEQDVIDQKKNIFTPYYQCTYGTAIVHGMGEPIGAILAPGKIAGKVWLDQNFDGKISGQEDGISGIQVRLTPENSKLKSQTTTTDADGNYAFHGLLPEEKFTVSIENPDLNKYACFTVVPRNYDPDSMAYNAKSTAETSDKALTEISAESENTSENPYTEDAQKSFDLHMNFGLCPYVQRKAILVWDDQNDRDKLRSDVTFRLWKKSGQETKDDQSGEDDRTKSDTASADNGDILVASAVIPKDAESQNRTKVFDSLMPIENNQVAEYYVTETLAANADKYTVATDIKDEGMTYQFTNTHGPADPSEPAKQDPPVRKEISGDKPSANAAFTFVLQAKSTTAKTEMPMPEGSVGNTKTVTAQGAGSAEFGYLYFWEPGTYVYEIREENTGEKNYTYDTAVYTVTYDVIRDWDQLSVTRTYRKDAEITDDVVFTNRYTEPSNGKNQGTSGKSSGDNSETAAIADVKTNTTVTTPPEEIEGGAETPGKGGNRRTPNTGDTQEPLLWAGIFTAAGLAILILTLRRKKGRE